MKIKHDNLDQTWEFYSLLGMRGGIEYQIPLPGGEAFEVMFMDCGERDHTLAFGLPPKGRINHIMFEVDNFDDVMFTYAKVKDKYPIAISYRASTRMIKCFHSTVNHHRALMLRSVMAVNVQSINPNIM